MASLNITGVSPGNNGFYSIAVPAGPAVGSNVLKVVYSGDSTYAAATSSITITGVTTLSTSVGLSYSTLATVGQPYTVSASINGTLEAGLPRTGTLSLVEGGNTLASVNLATTTPASSGYYALTVPAGLAAGTHSLSVVYSGDTNYSGSTAILNTVTSAVRLQSVGLGISYSTPLTGQAFSMTVGLSGTVLTGAARTGTLTLSEGGNTLASVNVATATTNSNGQFTLSVPAGFAAGSHSLVVTYSGDSNYASATSTLTLNIVNDSLSLSYPTSVLSGVAYTVNAAIAGAFDQRRDWTGTLSLMQGTTTLASVNVATATPNSSGQYAADRARWSGRWDLHQSKRGLQWRRELLGVEVEPGHRHFGQRFAGVVVLRFAARRPAVHDQRGHPHDAGGAAATGTLSLVSGSTTLASVNVATTTANSLGQYALTVPGGPAAGSEQFEGDLQRRFELREFHCIADHYRRSDTVDWRHAVLLDVGRGWPAIHGQCGDQRNLGGECPAYRHALVDARFDHAGQCQHCHDRAWQYRLLCPDGSRRSGRRHLQPVRRLQRRCKLHRFHGQPGTRLRHRFRSKATASA